MVYIKKSVGPRQLIEYRKSTPDASYDGLPSDIKEEIKTYLLKEQGCICAYCMSRIKTATTHIEHYIPQKPEAIGRLSDLDYRNMLGVCPGNEGTPYKTQTCDSHRKNMSLTVNPLVKSTIDTIRYSSSGHIESTNIEINKDLNETLNLNLRILVDNRKSALDKLKRELIKRKQMGMWIGLAQQYIEKLDDDGMKEPYCGILLWYLRTKAK